MDLARVMLVIIVCRRKGGEQGSLGPVTVVSLLSYKVAYGFCLAAEKHLFIPTRYP